MANQFRFGIWRHPSDDYLARMLYLSYLKPLSLSVSFPRADCFVTNTGGQKAGLGELYVQPQQQRRNYRGASRNQRWVPKLMCKIGYDVTNPLLLLPSTTFSHPPHTRTQVKIPFLRWNRLPLNTTSSRHISIWRRQSQWPAATRCSRDIGCSNVDTLMTTTTKYTAAAPRRHTGHNPDHHTQS